MANYERADRLIMAHNIQDSEVKLGHNHLSDWSIDELEKLFPKQKAQKTERVKTNKNSPVVGATPAEFDWRVMGGVTPIKDQMACGASWAFAAVAAIEGAHYAQWS